MDFVGTDGNNSIAGTSKDDVIYSGAGNDTINSGAGNDIVVSGGGNSVINSGAGNDVILTGNGNNILSGDAGNDIIIAGSGKDIIGGGTGNDILSGGAGADVFQYKAGFGKDIITDLNFSEGDYINLYVGAFGNAKNVQIKSQSDVDKLVANGSVTLTTGSNGSATLAFDANNSITLVGYTTATKQNFAGNSGNNTLIGGNNGLVHLTGGKGEDIMIGAKANTLMEGGDGVDVLIGGTGNDRLNGGAGDDVLSGGRGNDQLNGGLGNDILSGGQGADLFSFSDKLGSWGNDTITDFKFSDKDYLNVQMGSGKLTKISTLAQLNNYAASNGGVITSDAVSATVTFNSNESIHFLGLHATAGKFV